jgi:hypothetical protein
MNYMENSDNVSDSYSSINFIAFFLKQIEVAYVGKCYFTKQSHEWLQSSKINVD